MTGGTNYHRPGWLETTIVAAYLAALFFLSLQYYLRLDVEGKGFSRHVQRVESVVRGKRESPHPVFHYATYGLSRALNIPVPRAGAMVLGAANAASAGIIIWILMQSTGIRSLWVLIPASFATLLSASIQRPFFTRSHIVIGNGAVSVWVNSTSILLRPVVLLSFHFLVQFIDRNRLSNWRQLGTLSAAFALSTLIKPNYVLVLAPAVGLFFLARRLLDWKGLAGLVALFFPAGLILLWQYYVTYLKRSIRQGKRRRTLGFDLFRLWSRKSRVPGGVFTSIVSTCALPL